VKISPAFALKLPPIQAAMLLQHIHGPFPIRIGEQPQTRTALIVRKLIRPEQICIRPQATVLTEEGRRVVAEILAYYADMLVDAGFLEAELFYRRKIQDKEKLKFADHVRRKLERLDHDKTGIPAD
jgi:hypothetical protein